MKKTIIILLSVIYSHILTAQFGEKHAIYSTQELNVGNYRGVDIGLNYVYNEKYSFKVGYIGNVRTPKSKPQDYDSGIIVLPSLGLSNPHDYLESFQVGFGKIYKLNSGKVRINASLGVGYTVIREPHSWERVNNSIVTSNYTWEEKKMETFSLIINPKIEFPFTRIYGFTIPPMVQVSPKRTYVGIGFGQMIGLLRKKEI